MESFSDQEKRHLLAEIIKHSQLNVQILEALVKFHGIEPNWMQVQLPNGRSMAQCLHTAHDMDILQRGTKRKASNDEPGSQSSDGHRALNFQEPHLVCCPPTAPRPLANIKDSQAMLLGHPPQLPQASELPPAPKKKKGRPAYAGRGVTSQQTFSPRPIAPKPPPQQTLQQAPSLFRPIAPSPYTILPPLPREPLRAVHRGMRSTLSTEGRRTMGVPASCPPIIRPRSASQARQVVGFPHSLSPIEKVHNRFRSQSEMVSPAIKQEPTENNQLSSLHPLKVSSQTKAKENDASDCTHEGEAGLGEDNNGRP